MDFSQTTEQVELAALARQIVTDVLTPQRLAEVGAEPDRLDRALWQELARSGVLAAGLPVEVGGDGLGLLADCAVLVELGRAVAPVPYLASIVTAGAAVARFGDDAQRKAWAEPAGRGELLLTAALTARSPVRARRDGDRWVVDGVATSVPAGPAADVVLLPAATAAGPVVLAVLPQRDEVTVERQYLVDGQCHGQVALDGLTLPADRAVGAGADVSSWLRDRATVGLCALQLGVTERALELTAEHARTRIQFGRPIGTFQAVAQRLADAYVDVEAIRCTMWQAAWRLAEGLGCPTEVATAKFWAADGGHRVAHTAVHVHGGAGIDLTHPVHRYFVAAKYAEFALGGATDQLLRLGAALAAGVA
ncbi:MAG TPA: acyl-CoA dehydrogenase family protein [Kineosporiaceae bacterium]